MHTSGVQVKAATKRVPETTTTYGSGNASSPTLLCPIISEDLKQLLEFDEATDLAGQAGRGESEVVRKVVGGNISTEAWYHGLEYLFLCAMGFENPTVYTGVYGTGSGGSPAPNDASPECYYHLFELDDDLEIRAWAASDDRDASSGSSGDPTYWTTSDRAVRVLDIGIDKDLSGGLVERFEHCAVDGFQLNVAGDKVTFDWPLIGYSKDSDLMNHTSWATLSRDRALFTGARFYLSTYSAGSWSYASSEYGVAEIQLKLENGLRRDFVSGPNSDLTEEPIREGFRKVSAQVKLARMNATLGSLLDTFSASNIPCAAMIELTGPEITTGHYFRMRFMLPLVKIRNYQAPVAGPGVIQPSFELTAEKPTLTPTWIEDLAGGVEMKKDNELVVQLVNEQPACFSRDRQASGVALP